MYRTVFWTLWERERVGEWHWNMYNIIYEMSHQSRFDARYWMLGTGALAWPRGMVRGGRREEGSGWGTHVYLWQIHFDIWKNQYNIIKLNKIKFKKIMSIIFILFIYLFFVFKLCILSGFFKFYFIFKLYIIVLALPNIKGWSRVLLQNMTQRNPSYQMTNWI